MYLNTLVAKCATEFGVDEFQIFIGWKNLKWVGWWIGVTNTMSSAYEIAKVALRGFMKEEREKRGPQPAGGEIMDGHTICIGADGTMDIIPLDILSDPVNLKRMWLAMKNPVAIAFREWIYDWYCIMPLDDTFREWQIVCMPGRDHMMYRARGLAEHAIRNDFRIDDAVVKEIGG